MKKLNYLELTYTELDALDRNNTVFLSSISPLETHGSHLPLGTDIYIAENLRDRIADRLIGKYPELTIVYLPTIPFGADAIPVKGSVKMRYKAVYIAVHDTGATLHDLGFKYWILTDNHGGPHHQIGMEIAARELAAKGFTLIPPFHTVFRNMVAHDPDMMSKTGLGPGTCGDSEDAHGGTNETSLMLAAKPDQVRDSWKTTGPGRVSEKKLPFHILSGVADILKKFGANDAATDFEFLAHALSWVNDPNMEPYQGNPSIASKEAGEAMLNYHAGVAIDLFEKARAGNKVPQSPLGWSIRLIKDLM